MRARLRPAQAALRRAADALARRPGASDADAQLQQTLGGLRPGLARLNSPVMAQLQRPCSASAGSWVRGLGGWLVTGKVVVGQDVAYFEF